MAILNRWFKLWWVTFLNPTLRASWSTCRHPSPHDNHWPPFLSFLDHSHSKQIPPLPDRTPAPCLSHVRLPHELSQIFETKLKLSIPCHAWLLWRKNCTTFKLPLRQAAWSPEVPLPGVRAPKKTWGKSRWDAKRAQDIASARGFVAKRLNKPECEHRRCQLLGLWGTVSRMCKYRIRVAMWLAQRPTTICTCGYIV